MTMYLPAYKDEIRMPSYVVPVQRKTARHQPRHQVHGTRGYYLVCGIRDGLFAISLTGIFAILLGPIAYGLGV